MLQFITLGQDFCKRAASQYCLQSGLGQEPGGPPHIYHVGDRDDWVKDAIVDNCVHMDWYTVLGQHLIIGRAPVITGIGGGGGGRGVGGYLLWSHFKCSSPQVNSHEGIQAGEDDEYASEEASQSNQTTGRCTKRTRPFGFLVLYPTESEQHGSLVIRNHLTIYHYSIYNTYTP